MAITFEDVVEEVFSGEYDKEGLNIYKKAIVRKRRWKTLKDLYLIRRDYKEDGTWNTTFSTTALSWYWALYEFILSNLIKAFDLRAPNIRNGYSTVLLGPLVFPYWILLSVFFIVWTFLLPVPIIPILGLWTLLFEIPGDIINGKIRK